MSAFEHIEIDRERVRVEAERQHERMRSPWVWGGITWGLHLVLFLLILAIPDILMRVAGFEPLPWSGLGLVLRGAFAGVAATVQTLVLWSFAKRSVEDRGHDVRRWWVRLTATGWLKRVGLYSAAAAVGIGVPVGVLLSFALLPDELPFGSRPGMVGIFVALTFLWVFPMGLAIRYAGKRQMEKYIRAR